MSDIAGSTFRNCATIVLLTGALAACGGEPPAPAGKAPVADTPAVAPVPAIPSNPLKEAYFGETHLHTAYSLDAYLGGTRLTPDDAYRFARGEEMEVNGEKVKIDRPLGFAAVTDHAEYLGEMYSAIVEGAPGHDQDLLKELRTMTGFEEREAWFGKYVVANNRGSTPRHAPFFAGPETVKSAWKVILEAAEKNNEPGVFTAIPAFEWSAAPKGANLHRNVFFRDANVPDMPMSYVDINREEGLWQWMVGLEEKGMKVFAVPHNSNASKKMMFAPDDSSGKPLDRDYANLRARFEPLIEMMQIKGNSEVHRNFWAADEFSDFENADSLADYSGRALARENFVRYGLVKGLAYEKSLGANPWKYGIVGGTDNHNGTPGNVAEDNWAIGSHGGADGTVDRRRTGEVGGWARGKDLNPGSLTGVWAAQNTRAAIWDAMKAKETFGTSGPRIKVRLFAGFELPEATKDGAELVRQGYAKGVPMGGTLTPAAMSTRFGQPTFTVWASKDANDGNLDRIQIIKGWIGADGSPQETIVNVVWSGERALKPDGSLPAVGSTVDLKTATYSNDIGSPELLGSWTDKSFDPSQAAVYYARVLQIPTPRWSTYDAVRAGLPLLKDVPATVSERAWTSPIWYTPGA
ncbi:MAG: DUF3604 domain-containing protein [Chromatiales bacterium]|jgi:hypothetical protein|nr:MAG: DUF3604 domain-containing protein [Chromatiales bacterium]